MNDKVASGIETLCEALALAVVIIGIQGCRMLNRQIDRMDSEPKPQSTNQQPERATP